MQDDGTDQPWQSLTALTSNQQDDQPWDVTQRSSLDAALVYVFMVSFCFGIIGNFLCLVGFAIRRRSCLTVDVCMVSIYVAAILLLVRSISSFYLQFVVSTFPELSNYDHNRVLICILPYAYASLHMGVFYTIALIAMLQYLTIVWPQYSLRPRHVAAFVVVIWTFSFFINIHFLVVHCRAYQAELYFDYVKTVFLKFVFVDGSAFLLALFLLARSLITVARAPTHLPDKQLLRDDCLAVLVVLCIYTTPVLVDSLMAIGQIFIGPELIHLHYNVILTLHVTSLAAIPLILATTRPATRADLNGLFDRWRNCCDRCYFDSEGPSVLRITMSSVANGLSNAMDRHVEDDQVQILAVENPTALGGTDE